MKKITKLLLFIVTIFICLYSSNIFAISNETSYISINNTQNFEVGNLSFSNINFNDYSLDSTQAIGLSGVLVNNSNEELSYRSTINYYDSSYNLITQANNLFYARPGSSNFAQMSNLNILNGKDVSQIYYYRLSIEILDNNNLSKKDSLDLTPSKNSKYKTYDYVIDKYNVDIIVNENNTFDITETITAYFNSPRHGIYRNIPLKNDIVRLNGSITKNRAKISNISINEEYTTSIDDGEYQVKIGSADKTITGEHKYEIKYTYNLGKDKIRNYDELYYNIIGNGWDTVIGNITFTITMPKAFDISKLGFSSGAEGSIDNRKIKYSIDGKTIIGSYNDILDVNEALTVRCELPEGYFVGEDFISGPLIYMLFIIPILGFIISFIFWYKYGHDDMLIETVEFYPPNELNSLEIGFMYKGKAEKKDVTSLLIYLANKGYLKISESEDLSLHSVSGNFEIIKLKDYDGNDINEQLFLEGLFSNNDINSDYTQIKGINNKAKQNGEKIGYFETSKSFNQVNRNSNNEVNSVTFTDLYNKFYITMNNILDNVNSLENMNKIFEKNTIGKAITIILLIFISMMTTICIPIIDYAGFEELGHVLLIFVFYLPFFAVEAFSKVPPLAKLYLLGFTSVHLFFFLSTTPLKDAITTDVIYLLSTILGILCLIGMIVLLKLMPKRTKYGNEMLGRVKGFKNFLETAEKEKLEALVMQEPTYFYDILPYTYVLGISDKWIEKFETISLQAPTWYDSPYIFDISSFDNFINSAMNSAENTMSSSPSSGSDGGSSGGGSSGGGSGGGGGGSW